MTAALSTANQGATMSLNKMMLAICLIVNIALYQAKPFYEQGTSDEMRRVEIAEEEIFQNENTVGAKKQIKQEQNEPRTRFSRAKSWACAKWTDGNCVKWIRVGFWFGFQ